MIVFEKVSYKNFLSTGNTPTEIFLNRVPSALITGHNGAGKSTILDAITYGLYGKPYRNINKPQLLNTVNEKNLEVELDFKVNEVSYKVIRGIKPGKFEIYREGTLIEHDAAIKDYQNRLETIVGMNYKAFTQIVILGSARYQSFMDLSSNDRRTIIEEILDITVFSKMNTVLKNKMTNTELDIKDNDYQKELGKTKISSQKGLLKNLLSRSQESEAKIADERTRIEDEISQVENKLLSLQEMIVDKQEKDVNELHDKLSSIKIKGNEMRQREKAAKDRITFYEMSSECETCKQPIDEYVKEEQILIQQGELSVIDKAKPAMGEALGSIQTKIDEANEFNTQLREMISESRSLNNQKKTLQQVLRNTVVTTKDTDDDDIAEARQQLEQLEKDLKTIEIDYLKLVEEKHSQEICKILLKDDGIKAKIIKQYLPIMNNLINRFLDRMGANYSFHLDEQFNEVIKSRYRDTFSYASFSEGEKQRIDLALMFTWREIAKLKNSIATNLLILDEIGDSSMDGEGTDVLWDILKDMADTNIFVISHKTSNVDKFSSHIEFFKDGNFSKIKDSK